MGKDDFTGFDPESAKDEIRNLEKSLYSVLAKFVLAHDDLMSEDIGLYYVWCSPNAVQFGKDVQEAAKSLYNQILTEFEGRVQSAKRAYNIIAARNNCPTMPLSPLKDLGDQKLRIGNDLIDRHPNGRVGINPPLATMVKTSYSEAMADCMNDFNKIPKEISFYDESGAQADAFAGKLNELSGKLLQLLLEIEAEIQYAIEHEVREDTLAKNQVVTTLNA